MPRVASAADNFFPFSNFFKLFAKICTYVYNASLFYPCSGKNGNQKEIKESREEKGKKINFFPILIFMRLFA